MYFFAFIIKIKNYFFQIIMIFKVPLSVTVFSNKEQNKTL